MKGKTLGRFRLEPATKSGVMGEVLFGHDPELDRGLAIKRIKIEHADDLEAARDEARALAACGAHGSIPAVHDFFKHDGSAFIVMERVRGAVLGGDGDGRRRPKQVAVAITMNIVRALRHIHNCGYLHMDIKPRNVLLRAGTKTNVALIDFGGASRKGRGGRYRGKPRAGYPPYMAPEQFDSPATLDDSADLFQAAGVCVFMLTGMMPIDAPNLDGDAYDSACRTLQMKGLGRHIADVKLRAVLAKALDPKPSKRYRHAQDFIDALRPFGE